MASGRQGGLWCCRPGCRALFVLEEGAKQQGLLHQAYMWGEVEGWMVSGRQGELWCCRPGCRALFVLEEGAKQQGRLHWVYKLEG
jgi:hypothetical protein